MKTPYSLLVDIGGTDVKLALAVSGEIVPESIHRVKFPAWVSQETKEFLPGELLQIVIENIDKFLAKNTIERIFFSGQMGSWLLTTSTGTPVTNIVSWQSTDGADEVTLKKIYGDRINDAEGCLKNTGREDWIGAPWRTVPRKVQFLEPYGEHICFHTLVSWIVWEISSREAHLVHLTDAASTGMYSLQENIWLGDFQQFGLDIRFPIVQNEIVPMGRYQSTQIPVYVGIGDQQASIYGTEAPEGSMVINAGTGCQVSRISKIFNQGPYKTRPFLNNLFLETFTHIPAGRYLAVLVDHMRTAQNVDVQWGWLYQRGLNFKENEITTKAINWDFENFLKDINFEQTPGQIFDSFLFQLSRNIVQKSEQLGLKNGDVVYLAGGVATRLEVLHETLLNRNCIIKVIDEEESTLKGLAKLSFSS